MILLKTIQTYFIILYIYYLINQVLGGDILSPRSPPVNTLLLGLVQYKYAILKKYFLQSIVKK